MDTSEQLEWNTRVTELRPRASRMPDAHVFDRVSAHLRRDPLGAMAWLFRFLESARRSLAPSEWQTYCRHVFQRHALVRELHQSPFSRRAFEKPRGYAGDAVMIDMVYEAERLALGLPEPARSIFGVELLTTGGDAVRARRDRMAAILDELPTLRPKPRAASVACGHLREAQRSRSVQEGLFGELCAFDQDERSLCLVGLEQHDRARVRHGRVREIIDGTTRLVDYDLIYSTGLYDYLPDVSAAALTRRLFDGLATGGRLVIANLTPVFGVAAYIEAVADWWLVYRAARDMTGVLAHVDREAIASVDVYEEHPGVAFLEVVKR